jgi:regulation of enolase protein 1 (concanavalin A-like superfamily)
LDSPLPDVRRGGVGAVGEWLGSDDPAKVLTARQILTEIADNDISRVAALARELLDAKTAETKQEKEDGKPPPRHWPFWPRTRRARIVALSGAAGLLLVIAIIVPITVSSHHSPQPAMPLACGGIQDSFASPTLAAGWNETLPNGGTADLASSKLRITAQDGSDYAGSTDTAPTVSRDVTGDFTAQTEVDAAPAHTYQGAGLVVSADNGNYVRLERGYGDVGAIAFEHMQDGSYTKVASPFSADQSRGSELARTDATAVQLMLHRTGGTLRASWRAVGSTTWQDVGEVPAPDQSGAPLHVGLAVVNRAQPPQGDPARTPFSASFSSADITCA